MRMFPFSTIAVLALTGALTAAAQSPRPAGPALPRTADGKPNFEGIWQAAGSASADLEDHVARLNMPAGRSVVTGGNIPYQPWAAAKKAANLRDRQKTDPLAQCFIPGVPRIMYLDFPFQIFQTPGTIAMAFEWSLDYRLIFTNGTKHPDDSDGWMGDSRGHWEGDTLIVDVANNNDKTWLDMAGNFHSEALHVVERYRMTGPDTIQYEATLDDAKVFTKPWTINVPLHRRTDRDRLFEYSCQSEVEELSGAFMPEPRTWYPGTGTPPPAMAAVPPASAAAKPVANFPRTADGKPNLQAFYVANTGAANQGMEKHPAADGGLTPAGRGIVSDPPDGIFPLQPWAFQERVSRNLPERGYDDPTAHCFPAGVPRSMYVPQGMQMIQTPGYVVFLFERLAWRIVSLNRREHLPASMRLWQGDSIGHWEGDTLVVDTTNFNGKTWLSEAGDLVSYAERVVERFTPAAPDTVTYEATVADPVAYTKPWTISFPLRREKFELTEAACHEEDRDLPHLKSIKDAAAAKSGNTAR